MYDKTPRHTIRLKTNTRRIIFTPFSSKISLNVLNPISPCVKQCDPGRVHVHLHVLTAARPAAQSIHVGLASSQADSVNTFPLRRYYQYVSSIVYTNATLVKYFSSFIENRDYETIIKHNYYFDLPCFHTNCSLYMYISGAVSNQVCGHFWTCGSLRQ